MVNCLLMATFSIFSDLQVLGSAVVVTAA